MEAYTIQITLAGLLSYRYPGLELVMLTDIDALKLVVAQEVPFVNFLIKLYIVITEKVFRANFCYKLNKYLNHITFLYYSNLLI